MDRRTLILSPIRQAPGILRVFLRSLLALRGEAEVWVIDDNDYQESSALLSAWKPDRCWKGTERFAVDRKPYLRNDLTHSWNVPLVQRVAALKDWMLDRVLETDAEMVLLVDSDLALNPQMLVHLRGLNLPVVCEVFWTRWLEHQPLLPQVWNLHPGTMFTEHDILQLALPGQFPMNGYGACTLVRREVLEAGVRFAQIPGVQYYGEDRQFCIRAAVHGVGGIADTCYPPFHIYRERLVPVAEAWLDAGAPREFFTNQLDTIWARRVKQYFDLSRHPDVKTRPLPIPEVQQDLVIESIAASLGENPQDVRDRVLAS